MAGRGTTTLTFCERAENHVGMQTIGTKATTGFTADELRQRSAELWRLGVPNYVIDLAIPEAGPKAACVLVVCNGVGRMLGDWASVEDFEAEQQALPVDKKALMRGQVKEKKARWNLCFD